MNNRSITSSLTRFLVLLTVAVAALGPLAGNAAANQPTGDRASAAVTVRAVPQSGVVKPGSPLVVAVVLDHGTGYHTWPEQGVKLPADVEEFAIRTTIELSGPASWTAKAARVQWPIAKTYELPSLTGDGKSMAVPLYSGRAVAFVAVDSPDAVGEYELVIAVGYQACDDSSCLPPADVELKVPIKVDATATASLNEPDLFRDYKPSDTAVVPVSPGPASGALTSKGPKSGEPAVSAGGAAGAGPQGATIFGVSLGSGLFLLALASMLGGFVLNLTPCVLPVIPIKVLTLTQHAVSQRHALVLGVWMAMGVVAFWTAIGVPMAFVSASFDPSRYIFGVWWVTLGISLIIALMALGIMGLFTLNLPQAVYMVDAKADSPLGSFMFGVLTAVLGLPCFGFVAGGLLAGAATLPAASIMVIFVGLGVGMAAPYLVLSAKPSLLRFIPRTGPASELVKQVMGVLLLAAAAFFASAGIKALISDRPYLTGSISWWAAAFFIAIAGGWLVIRTLQIAKTSWPKVLMPVLAVLMVGGVWVLASGRLKEDHRNWEQRIQFAGTGLQGDIPSGVWLDYSPELFMAVRKSGKSVFLDFTADWCINCKVFKRSILDQTPTSNRLASAEIVLMEVDCTSTNSAGWTLLRELGRTGIPTWVIYGPGEGAERPIILDLTTPTHQTVLHGLERAGVKMDLQGSSTAAR